jgi:CDP-paratose 2-epimerase
MNFEKALVTGGAGFIGCNVANFLLNEGHDVVIFDNLSRRGTNKNLDWLVNQHGPKVRFILGDIRECASISKAMDGVDVVFHLAAQTAVTSSVIDPREDFEVNAQGTFNVLEAARKMKRSPVLVYASTNKVYGAMEDALVQEDSTQYKLVDMYEGVDETCPVDFHSPYGCSKGAADQYTRDYARIYGIPTVVVRQSCIFGGRQFGVEDQGWVAWFLIAALLGRKIKIFGNGKQVRDILFIDDLIDFYIKALENIDISRGQVYNIGGGRQNAISVWNEFGPLLERTVGYEIPVQFYDWRPGDQLVYISNNGKANRELGWEPKISINEGTSQLFQWIKKHRNEIEEVLS